MTRNSAMDADRWQRLKRAFEAARGQDATEQPSDLRKVCGDDPDLEAEVQALLRGHETEGPLDRLLEGMDEMLHHRPPEIGLEGQRIGPYALVEELGEGGMGRVFLARRADGQFEQQVAVKLLGIGVVSPDAQERFLAERQILARLDHPNIARLLDGGVTDTSQPYFVMEAVDGQPLDQYADANGLSVEERLKLFLEVCDAVQSAHQQLIVHRDLKPSNILVTDEGTVKLLDFGIAKLLEPDPLLSEGGPRTRTGWHPMTPEYASPEQVRGDPISTASDVYQLGLVLYKLLTGRRPYSVDGRTPGEIERIVCEVDPPRPSAVVSPSSDAADESADAPRLEPRASRTDLARRQRKLHGDLDAIVLKALRKASERRYDSVEQLSEDLRRFLGGRPVSARPNTWAYRGRKFVRRHRGSLAVGILILLLLAGYGGTLTWHSRQMQAALEQTQREAEKSEQVTEFLVGMFEQATPYGSTGPASKMGDTLTAGELLDRGAARVRTELSEQPDVQVRLMSALGRINRDLGRYEEAEPLLERALALHREHLPPDDPARADLLHEFARLLRHRGDMQRAGRLYRESLSIQRAHLDGDHPRIADNLRELAIIAAREGRYSQADSLFREALTMRKSLHGPDHPDVATELHVLGLLYVMKDDLAEAERLLRESLEMRRNHVNTDHPLLAETLDRLGQVLVRQGKLGDAEPLLRKAHAMRAELFQEVHPSRAVSLNNLGRLLQKKENYAEAEEHHRKAQAIYQELYGAENLDAANTLYERAEVHRAKGAYEEAESMYRRAASMQRSLHGPEHPSTRRSLNGLSALYDTWGKSRKADSLRSLLATDAP